MVNLEPIPKVIQERLFEKMNALGRITSYSDTRTDRLVPSDMNSRSTFIKMVSGNETPIMLTGGELKKNQLQGGFDDIYGSREAFRETLVKQTRYDISTVDLKNEAKRPIPGIKSIEASFKGGMRAHREATIQWTCWSFEDLNRLMPHFLSHGKTVLIEWGWIYRNQSIVDIPSMIFKDGNKLVIKDKAFSDYKDEILKHKGDFDLMVGQVKNFEFTTRADGGFDCQTIIGSLGVNLVDSVQPNSEQQNTEGEIFNLELPPAEVNFQWFTSEASYTSPITNYNKKELDELKSKLKTVEAASTKNDNHPLISLNTDVSLKLLIKNLGRYINDELSLQEGEKREDEKFFRKKINGYPFQDENVKDAGKFSVRYKKNKFIAIGADNLKIKGQKITDSFESYVTDEMNSIGRLGRGQWVRWGWFEDNILSKFASITSTDSKRPITEFRSIESILTVDGDKTGDYESTRIRNNKFLQTMDIRSYILPGQFSPQKEEKFPITYPEFSEEIDEDGFPKNTDMIKDTVTLTGDNDVILELSNQVNNTDNFPRFACGNVKKSPTKIVHSPSVRARVEQYKKDVWAPEKDDPKFMAAWNDYDNWKNIPEFSEEKGIDFKYGYLRNMLVNVAVIEEAFGVRDGQFNIEALTINEAIQSLFDRLNQDLSYWRFILEPDALEPNRIKVVDQQTTAINFDKKIDTQKTKYGDGEITRLGYFEFPIWQADSLVKSQNITAKIPSALALSTMYGANINEVKDFVNTGNQFSSTTGVIAGGLAAANEKDKTKKGADIAIRNENSRGIGTKNGFATEQLTTNGEEDGIYNWLIDNYNVLKKSFSERVGDINAILVAEGTKDKVENRKPDEPAPILDFLDDPVAKAALFETAYFSSKKTGSDVKSKYNTKYSLDGKMKAEFIKTMKYILKGAKEEVNADEAISVLIPLDMELEVDGTGGIYPGNSFHSSYLPQNYRQKTVFQMFDVNHKVDSSGWHTTIVGKMRSSIGQIFNTKLGQYDKLIDNVFSDYKKYITRKKEVTGDESLEANVRRLYG